MSETVLGVRLTIDGKEVTGGLRAQQEALRQLGRAAKESNTQAKDAADQFTASLKRQADTLGMTRTQTMAYEASQHQLTTAQRQQVAESIRAIDAHEKQERMLGRVKTAAAAAGAALVAALSAGLKASVAAAIESEQAQLRLEAVLKATGYAAGFNGRELEKMASGMQRRLGIDDETVKKSMAVLLTFRSVQRESFGEAMEVAANLSKVMGTDLHSAVLQLGKALENPEQGLTALTRSGVTFDAAQKSMIENLVATGRQAEAITLILKIMKEQGLDKVAEAMNQGLFKATNALKNEWNDLLETLGQTAVVKAPVEGALGSIEEKLRALRNLVEGDWVDRFVIIGSFIQPSPALGAMMRGVVARKRDAIDDAPVREGGLERYAINLGIERQRRDRARGQVQEYLQQFQSDNEKLALELKKFRELGQQAELSAAALLDGEARIRAKFAKKGDQKKPFDYVGNVFADVSDDLNKMAARLFKEEEVAAKAAADAIDRRTAVQQQAEAIQADFNRTQSETLKQIEFETQLLGLNEREREKAIALRKLENEYDKASVKLKDEDTDAWERRTAAMRRDYEQRKAELPAAIDRRVDARDIQKQIEEGRDAAKKMNEDLARGLTDSIFRGFEAGKSFARNFRDSLVNMFKTTILTPVIKWIVSPVTGALTTALAGLGIPGLANAPDGGAGGGFGQNLIGQGVSSLLGAGLFSSAGAYAGALGLSSAAAGSQAALLAAQTGVFGSAGLAATASSAGAGFASTALSALPYVGLALGAASLLGAFGGSKGGPAHFTGLDVSGTAGMSGLLGSQFTGNSANSKQPFSWQSHDHGATAGINASIAGLFADMTKLAQTLGLDASRLSNAQVPFSFRTTAAGNKGLGPTTEEVIAAFQQNMGQISDALALELMPNLREFAQANESATQTLVRLVAVQEQLRGREQQTLDAMRGYVTGLPDRLGITGLTGFRDSLAVSEFRSPLDRFGSARALLNENYGRAIGGDLAAVQAFPQLAQQLLGIGRDVYASGPQFAEVFVEVNRQLQDVLSQQQNLQTELLRDIDISLVQSAQDQLAELRRTREALVEELQNVRAELRRIAA